MSEGWRLPARTRCSHTRCSRRFGSIVVVARASQITLAAMSADIAGYLEGIRAARESEDVSFMPRHPDWISPNMVSVMRSAVEHYAGLPQAVWERVGERGVLAAHLAHAESGARFRAALARRTRCWVRRDVPAV